MRVELDKPLSSSEIVTALDGFTRVPIEDRPVLAVTTDTREMRSGDLFFALSGEKYDGESFCAEAAEAGCLCVSTSFRNGILVKSTKDALLKLTALYRKRLTNLKKTIAITGSVGKTTTKEFLRIMLEKDFSVHASEGNYNNYIGLAHTVLSCPQSTEILIAEIGMNHQGEIAECSKALTPDVAVITAIGTAHIGNLGSREMIAKAKSEIQDGLAGDGILLIPYGEELLNPTAIHKTVSTSDEAADLALIPLEASREGTRFILKNRNEAYLSSTGIFGEGNLRALAFSTAAAIECGTRETDLARNFSLLSQKNTRQNVFYWQNRCIIDDSYNASFESVIAAFDFMKFYRGRRCALLGDLLELGSKTEPIHFRIGAEAVMHGIELLFLHGVYAPFIARGAVCAGMPRERVTINTDPTDPQKTANAIERLTIDGDILLIKASHNSGLSAVIEHLNEKKD